MLIFKESICSFLILRCIWTSGAGEEADQASIVGNSLAKEPMNGWLSWRAFTNGICPFERILQEHKCKSMLTPKKAIGAKLVQILIANTNIWVSLMQKKFRRGYTNPKPGILKRRTLEATFSSHIFKNSPKAPNSTTAHDFIPKCQRLLALHAG
jgi:hypothetical protein